MIFSQFQDLFSLRNLAAKFLAASVKSLYPDAKVLSGGCDAKGLFYNDFFFPYPISNEMLYQLQENMHKLIKEQSLKQLEMVPASAKEYLLHLKNHYDVDQLIDEEVSLVELVKIGDFVDLCPSTISDEVLSKINHFQLLKVEQSDDRMIRILGAAFFEKSDLKNYLKAYKNHEKNFAQWTKKFFSYTEDGMIWLPKGRELISSLRAKAEETLLGEECFFLDTGALSEDAVLDPATLLKALHLKEPIDKLHIASWVKDYSCNESIFSHFPKHELWEKIYCDKNAFEAVLKKSLNKTVELLKELGVSFQLVISGHKECFSKAENILEALSLSFDVDETPSKDKFIKIQFYLDDTLGRFWDGPWVQVNCSLCEKERLSYSNWVKYLSVERSLMGPIEDLAVKVIEKEEGHVPFALCAEQVRIIPMDDQSFGKAEELLALCRSKGLKVRIDRRDLPSRELSRLGNREGVPFLVFVKVTSDMLFIREYPMPRAKEMDIEAFIKRVETQK